MALAAVLAVSGCARDATGDRAEPDPPPVTDVGTRPDLSAFIAADRGDPPAVLEIDDIVVGEGRTAQPGDVLTVHYVGVDWATGSVFDASWDRGLPYQLRLGEGMVIAGWDQGLVGVNEGGRRRLVIPPELAYGDRGSGTVIAPGATLVFIVDVVAIEPGPTRTEPST